MELFSLPLLSEGERGGEREKLFNKCARYRPLDNQSYYGYVFWVGDTCPSALCEVDDDQSPDL